MSDTEEPMDTANDKSDSDNTTPTKHADELEEELGGVDELPEGDGEEDSDQEYTTKKKKPIKKPEIVLDPAFQSRLNEDQVKRFNYLLEQTEIFSHFVQDGQLNKHSKGAGSTSPLKMKTPAKKTDNTN
ncbi:unnamed protein product [Adineta steineri]|uniref:Uncharacterized protein n=1 Tax=Adineta steineri TaxID=433720 RepID=A0A813VUX5_9BILA|nr:unnamed protein product [Adineta steineri]CAF1171875.1 unnamed protein product [Adineta steineri]